MSEPPAPAPEPPEPARPSPPPIREFEERGTLWLLEDPENLRGLLQILEPELVERLDFARARRINRSFVPADLQKQESDLVYAVPFREGDGREVWIYVLLEHQSEPDPLMGLRLYLYMGQLWDSQRREWQARSLPTAERRLLPVIPVLFYTGEQRWSRPLGLKELMDLPAELERFVPDWETLFLTLGQTPPETLTRFASAVGWALRVLQADKEPRAALERVLIEAMAGLEGLSEEQAGQWLRVAWFLLLVLLHRREEPELASLLLEQAHQSKFGQREEVTRMGLNLLEQAEARGEARGAENALRLALRTVLTTRFGPLPPEIESALALADQATMDTWLGRAANAATLEEVGIPAETPST
jgi:hypothetical protein